MAVHRFSVKQPAVPAQHHVLLGGHLEDLCIQDSVRRDQLLPEGEVVRNIVGSVLEDFPVEGAVLVDQRGGRGQLLVGGSGLFRNCQHANRGNHADGEESPHSQSGLCFCFHPITA